MAVATKKSAKLSLIASSALLLVGAGCSSTTDVSLNAPVAPAPEKTDTTVEVNVNAGANVNAPAMEAKEKPSASLYKDGTYEAVGHYKSPAGPEEIKVTLTLKGGVIVESVVVPQATNKKSVFMQDAFTSGYKALVVGKNIDEVNLVAAVSGSSLTPIGFNEAVAQVKAQAKS